MPRAPNGSSQPILRRNQACKTCRKKKLKCDAARPHCGNCTKAWKGLISVPAPDGFAHPTEPSCNYDPIEGLTLAESVNPAEKIRQLEEQITELKNKLQEVGMAFSPGSSSSDPATIVTPASLVRHGAAVTSPFAAPSNLPNGRSEIALPRAGLGIMPYNGGSPSSRTSSPGLRITEIDRSSPLDLLHTGWNPDLPDPLEMNKLVHAFFNNDPCGSHILHKASFMASLIKSPQHPSFPHPALLHAICASASRWTTMGDHTDNVRRDRFAEYHAAKTRQYIDRTMASGQDIFSVLQACVILTWYLYAEGRWVEVWIFAGFQTRVCIPLRLNYHGTFTEHGSSSPGAYLARPGDMKDLEMRRRTWWMAIVMDRIVSVGGWLHSIDEHDLATELPLTKCDFDSGYEHTPALRLQSLADSNFFVSHPADTIDSFSLFIKAVMAFGRVTNYNNRWQLRVPPDAALWGNPFDYPGFAEVDQLVSDGFLSSLPPAYRNYLTALGNARGLDTIDTDLFMVHVIPHAATITLHNQFIDWKIPGCVSNSRCERAAQRILEAYYIFYTATNIPMPGCAPPPITRLHPFVVICWYLAAVVKVRICAHMIEIGDSQGELQTWREINELRMAMLRFGDLSPIGVRQEILLQGVMADIVKKTKHDNPDTLVPLYPFSHKGVFAGRSYHPEDPLAPLPVTTEYEFTTTMPDWESHQDQSSTSPESISNHVTGYPTQSHYPM